MFLLQVSSERQQTSFHSTGELQSHAIVLRHRNDLQRQENVYQRLKSIQGQNHLWFARFDAN